MQHATLVAFLTGRLSPEDFGREIEGEVRASQRGVRKCGVGHVLIADGPEAIVTRENAKRLLQALADGRLSFLAANYAADCLIMSENFLFADDTVSEAVHFVSDESRVPTSDETKAAMAQLT